MEEVVIRPQQWNNYAAALLSQAEAPESLAAVACMVHGGAAFLFHVEDRDGHLLGAYVLRLDRGPAGPEGVIMSAAGRADFDLVAVMLPHVERQFSGVALIRFHTARPGLIRKAARQGWQAQEIIMTKQVGGLH